MPHHVRVRKEKKLIVFFWPCIGIVSKARCDNNNGVLSCQKHPFVNSVHNDAEIRDVGGRTWCTAEWWSEATHSNCAGSRTRPKDSAAG